MCVIPIPRNPDLCTEKHPETSDKEKRKATIVGEPKAPYFFYRNFSNLPDPDTTKPITAPGRIPNFPAKMMAILSRPDLADIISWMPHGRSWKVHKPREFEVKVIPTYFEHSKFSSFIRQANGWGFRRIISKGPDRNSYYHEMFLRGKPHLIKLMKRPTTTGRPQADANTEPDFYRISQEYPLPEPKLEDGAIIHDRSSDEKYRNRKYNEGKTSYKEPHVQQEHHKQDFYPTSNFHENFEPAPVFYSSRPHYVHGAAPVPGTVTARALTPVESHDALVPVHTHSMPVAARAVSPVQTHYDSYEYHCAPGPLPMSLIPGNQWTEHCFEPHEMPHDFEDPFAGGLTPIDFW